MKKGVAVADNCRPTTVEVSTVDGTVKDKPLYFFLERYTQAYIAEVTQFSKMILAGEKGALHW
ncbi:hypothetical protein GCM10020331_083160 [Ectobacillus funiculus]